MKAVITAVAYDHGTCRLRRIVFRWGCVQDAMHNGPHEKLAYVPAVIPDGDRPDYLCTVDLDPDSSTYSKASSSLPGPCETLHRPNTICACACSLRQARRQEVH